MAGHCTEHFSIQLSPKLAKDTKNAATEKDLTLSEWIRWALRDKLAKG